MLDANECREHARRFMQLSAEATDLVMKQRLAETAEGWARLAADLAQIEVRSAQTAMALKSPQPSLKFASFDHSVLRSQTHPG
jgi:hypothetical protein